MSAATHSTDARLPVVPGQAKIPRLSAALLRTQSDARLTRLAAGGYEGAFEALVQRYRGPLQGYCRRYLRPAAAEDVVQQAFLDLWARLAAGEEIREVRPWLYRVVHNAALNTIRRGDYRSEQLPDILAAADSPELAFERTAELREALAGVAALPEQQRRAIVYNAVDGHSRAEIALALGTSDGAVGQLLHRARATLRSAAGVLVPWPLIAWAAGRRGVSSTASRLLGTAGAGGAPAGVLLKGGATLAVIAAATAAPFVATHTPARAARPALATAGSEAVLHRDALGAFELVSALAVQPGAAASSASDPASRGAAVPAPATRIAEAAPAPPPASAESAAPAAQGSETPQPEPTATEAAASAEKSAAPEARAEAPSAAEAPEAPSQEVPASSGEPPAAEPSESPPPEAPAPTSAEP
jgi:RNA polymerase sigma factor (sigma-70 family)